MNLCYSPSVPLKNAAAPYTHPVFVFMVTPEAQRGF